MADPSETSAPDPKKLQAGSAIKVPKKPSDLNWKLQSAIGLTPEKLGNMISALWDGDFVPFMGFAEELESRDSHYASQLTVLKNAVAAMEWGIEGPEGAVLEECKKLLTGGIWTKLCKTLLDGEAKGFAVAELFWDAGPEGTTWMPTKVEWVDPRHFGYSGRKLMLRDTESPDDVKKFRELPPYVFAVYETGRKSGLPFRNGLALPCSVMHLFKSYAFKDWVQFLAIFGMPVRIAKYGQGTKDGDVQELQKAVDSIGEFASAVVPHGMTIEMESGNAQGNGQAFREMIDISDRQMSKVINGQTMISDDGSSQSQATVHENVQNNIAESVAEGLAEALTVVLRMFVSLNYGEQLAKDFRVIVNADDPEDINLIASAIEKLAKLGFEVSEAEVYERTGWTLPEDGDTVLTSKGRTSRSGKPPEPTEPPDAAGETDTNADPEEESRGEE